MSSIWGNNIKVALFGESHGAAIGVTIDGLPPGVVLDLDEIRFEMARRAPGRSETSTPRNESDEFEILSGYFKDRTTGTPLSIMIKNSDKRSRDYEATKNLARPGQADFTGRIRYNGFNDYRGGGHFSGRITAPLVFAGSVAKQILRKRNMFIGSHIQSIGHIDEDSFMNMDINAEMFDELRNMRLPVINEDKGREMEEHILKAKDEEDSVGGILELGILNPLPGMGSPFFQSIESRLSHMMFSIPAVKGIEFGAGFGITRMKGSEANDSPYYDNGVVKTYSNNNGGIIGGISSGMPIIFRVAIKPTASISQKQKTIDMENEENTEINIVGRHDPTIIVRAVPVLEAATALVMLDLVLELNRYNGI